MVTASGCLHSPLSCTAKKPPLCVDLVTDGLFWEPWRSALLQKMSIITHLCVWFWTQHKWMCILTQHMLLLTHCIMFWKVMHMSCCGVEDTLVIQTQTSVRPPAKEMKCSLFEWRIEWKQREYVKYGVFEEWGLSTSKCLNWLLQRNVQ